ncbi:MAG TPA: L-threonylcarbamoyladenylate synthase [Acidimicrobiales bacterium]|jgi:L-threonylcarbamoyladenylate synthase|nr:L-threonylcarbamoyladenylate synthase [Acidimicrobiales bacterium]
MATEPPVEAHARPAGCGDQSQPAVVEERAEAPAAVATPAQLSEAAAALAAGEVLAIPTDTVYGLAVDPRLPGAIEALFGVKGRPESLALPVLVATVEEAETLGVFGPGERALARAFWPGPLTIVVQRAATAASWRLGGDEETVGLRRPRHEITESLLGLTGPLAVTSANRHGSPPCQTAAEVMSVLGDEALILDGGTCDGRSSTVVSLLDGALVVMREGPLAAPDLEAVLRSL